MGVKLCVMGYNGCACGNQKANHSKLCHDCYWEVDFQPKMITEGQIAWVAGILEGEGTWCYRAANPKNWWVAVRMTDRDIIERLYTWAGVGHCYFDQYIRGVGREHHNAVHQWVVSVKPHREWLAQQVWPWLGERRKAKIRQLWPDILGERPNGEVTALQAV
jgi:hypothetical protein